MEVEKMRGLLKDSNGEGEMQPGWLPCTEALRMGLLQKF